eukprot:5140426-Amphidinium_carterae.1
MVECIAAAWAPAPNCKQHHTRWRYLDGYLPADITRDTSTCPSTAIRYQADTATNVKNWHHESKRLVCPIQTNTPIRLKQTLSNKDARQFVNLLQTTMFNRSTPSSEGNLCRKSILGNTFLRSVYPAFV